MAVTVGRTRFDGHTARVTVSVNGERFDLAITSRTRIPMPAFWADVWLPLAIFPAMRTGSELRLTERMSAGLRRNLASIQAVLSTFHPELHRVPVTVPASHERVPRRATAMQMFTGGVDSFFTLQSHPEVATLVYVHDLVHDVPEVRDRVTGLLDSVSFATGKEVLHLETDLRSMLDLYAEWGTRGHGAALSSVAALVSHGATDFYVPATHTYLEMYPWGSHPVLDHLWGSDTRRIWHDGAHAGRFEKIRVIATNPVAITHLRVCWKTTTELNCSRCEKCVRTMISLDLAGALDSAVTFRGPLDRELVRSVRLDNDSDVSFALDNLEAATRAGRSDLAVPLAEVIDEYRSR